ncbi:polyprenyl synthetase family protein [Paenibacillus sp. J5C_2022]|uniref:polyprenyl synthetase family protein n=1 Tax=Paenibacillus sp. J5C2022 TaxID=2977129 RepID=UPI0021CE7FAA|nr:polyprenyl synthetase family protein [Paenibacillus sp. J5C2022]MCU6711830.1 polyprenyl synthetase family protein [Paenibacillus sp. J5C2022]
MDNSYERIGQCMKDLVYQWFEAEPLARHAILFVEDKLRETNIFGELTVFHYHMFNGRSGQIYQAAAAVELFLLASDMLDDLQDGDAPSKPWMQVPQPIAIHVAASIVTLSQQALMDSVMNRSDSEALARMMNRQLLQAANGQMLDLMNEIHTEEAYLDMVRMKSASIFVFACMTGVMVAGHPWHDTVAEYAVELGISAQIKNDVRDMLKWDEKNDFLQRKRNLLLLYMMEERSEEHGWIADYLEERLTVTDVSHRKEMFLQACEQSGAILYGSVIGRKHYNRCLELVGTFPQGKAWQERLSLLLSGYSINSQTTQNAFR